MRGVIAAPVALAKSAADELKLVSSALSKRSVAFDQETVPGPKRELTKIATPPAGTLTAGASAVRVLADPNEALAACGVADWWPNKRQTAIAQRGQCDRVIRVLLSQE